MEFHSQEATKIIAAINRNPAIKGRLGITPDSELSADEKTHVELMVKLVRDKVCSPGKALRLPTKDELQEMTLDAVIEIERTITTKQLEALQDASFVGHAEKLKILTEEIARECMNVFSHTDDERALAA